MSSIDWRNRRQIWRNLESTNAWIAYLIAGAIAVTLILRLLFLPAYKVSYSNCKPETGEFNGLSGIYCDIKVQNKTFEDSILTVSYVLRTDGVTGWDESYFEVFVAGRETTTSREYMGSYSGSDLYNYEIHVSTQDIESRRG